MAFAPVAGALEAGHVVDDAQLRSLDGGNAALLARDAVNVSVFFRPGHDHSLEALRAVGACQAAFAGKPVKFASVVLDDAPEAEVRGAL